MRAVLLSALVLWRLVRAANVTVLPNDTAVSFSPGWTNTILFDTLQNGNTFAGNTVSNSNVNGANATLTFTGDAIWFVTTNWPDGAAANLYLDGVSIRTIPLQAGNTHRNVQVLAADGLSNTRHTLTIVASISPTAPNETWCDVEGFIVHQADVVGGTAAPVVAAPPQTTTPIIAAAPPPATSMKSALTVATPAKGPLRMSSVPAGQATAISNVAAAQEAGSASTVSDDDSSSPALVPALAATGGVATLCFVSLAILYFLRRRKREQQLEGTVIGSSVIGKWVADVPAQAGTYEKMGQDSQSVSADAETKGGGRGMAWSHFYTR